MTPLFLLRLTLAPILVGLASLAGKRFGARVAGLAAALPIVAGPILFIFCLQQGTAFAGAAAASTLLGLFPLALFCLSYALMASLTRGLPRPAGVLISLLSGWAVFLGTAFLLLPFKPPVWACPLFGALALGLGLLFLPSIKPDARPERQNHPLLELGLRMGAAAGLVMGLTGLAAALGPAWSGLLTPFPVASTVMVAAAHLSEGPQGLGRLMKGFLQGLFGFVAFLTVLAFGLQAWGLAPAFGLGLLLSLAVQGLLFLRIPKQGQGLDPA